MFRYIENNPAKARLDTKQATPAINSHWKAWFEEKVGTPSAYTEF